MSKEPDCSVIERCARLVYAKKRGISHVSFILTWGARQLLSIWDDRLKRYEVIVFILGDDRLKYLNGYSKKILLW